MMKLIVAILLLVIQVQSVPIVLYGNKTPDSMNGSDYEMRSLYIYQMVALKRLS